MHSFSLFGSFASLSLIQFDSELPSYFRQKKILWLQAYRLETIFALAAFALIRVYATSGIECQLLIKLENWLTTACASFVTGKPVALQEG